MEKRAELNAFVCPIVKKVADIEIIKVGRNPYLNIKELKSEKIKREKLELIKNQPEVIITMNDLDES